MKDPESIQYIGVLTQGLKIRTVYIVGCCKAQYNSIKCMCVLIWYGCNDGVSPNLV